MRSGEVIEAPPAPDRWDFGGHPYGLEPLTLPVSATFFGEPDGGVVDSAELAVGRDLRAPVAVHEATLSAEPDSLERLFWFRWITGHQTTFILWQLLTNAVRRGARNGEVIPVDEDACRVFVRGYSAMLLYTGSCPRSVYHAVIRPSMALQHPGFSGTWARDFWPVRGLLRSGGDGPASTPIARECALNVALHEAIAQKLVPEGQSLLKSAVRQEDMSWKRPALAVLYDTYFLTLRAPIPYEVVLRQLMRRLHAISWDLTANGLYPDFASSAAEKPAGMRTAWAEEYENTIPETLIAIATHAARGPRAWEAQ